MPILKMIGIFIVVIVLTESLFRKSFPDTLNWIFTSPLAFALNLMLMIFVAAVLLIFTRNIAIVTFSVSAVSLILNAINIGKYSLRNVPLLVDDFMLAKEVWVLMPQLFNIKVLIQIIIGALLLVAYAMGLRKFFKKEKLQGQRLIAIFMIAISIPFLMLGQTSFSSDQDILETGFLYSLSNNTREASIVIDDAQLEEADSLMQRYVKEYNAEFPTPTEEPVKPNIIIIQSEAYWDIDKLDIKMTENPNAFFESLRKESRYGEMYVPVIGGGTSNTEYEILTGMTLKNYSNDWYMVYPNEIKSPVISMASILRNQGYSAVGIHPYMSWYYNRYDVYNYLGFDTFKTLEFMNDVRTVGGLASDDYSTDMIIHTIESETNPVFNFIVTMQNHGPFGNARFAADEFTVDIKTKMSDSSRYLLHNYVQGLSLTDQALEKLVNYLKASDEPTIILFYGDHLPALGDDYQAYRELGYVGNEDNYSLQNDLKMMSVPYILWSNFDNTSEKLPTMNASFMSSYILNYLNLDMPDYLKALYMARREMPVYFRTFGFDENGNRLEKEATTFLNTKALYVSIFNDLGTGAEKAKWAINDNPDYNKSLSEIAISDVKTEGSKTALTGGPFYQNMKVLINQTETAFTWVSDTEVTLGQALKTGDTIEISLSDSEGRVLAELKAYEVK